MASADYSPNNISSAGWTSECFKWIIALCLGLTRLLGALWIETTWQTLVWEMLLIPLALLLLQPNPSLRFPPIRLTFLSPLPPNIAYKLNSCTYHLRFQHFNSGWVH